jgi:hypothetical protein
MREAKQAACPHGHIERMHLNAGCIIFFLCYGRCIMTCRPYIASFVNVTALAVPARALVTSGTLVFPG